MTKKIIISIIAIILLAISINSIIAINIGYAAFDALSLEVQHIFSFQYVGDASLIINLIYALIMLIYFLKYKKHLLPLIISIISIFFITRVFNLFTFIQYIEIIQYNIYLSFFFTLILLSISVLLISKANLLIPPYDKFVVELSLLLKIELGKVRIVCDSLTLLLSIILGYLFNYPLPLSIFTFILTFGLGTCVSIIDYTYLYILKKVFKRSI